MALEHALLVALTERPGTGLELTRRFDRSIGLFWQATHQQVYRTLGRMERDGWVQVETAGRPGSQRGRGEKRYVVAPAGADALRSWLAEPQPTEQFRSALTVRLRGASYGDRAAVLDDVRTHLTEHAGRLAGYEAMCARDYPDPAALSGAALDQYLVLRGGIGLERFWVDWLTECLAAHDAAPDAARDPAAPDAAAPDPTERTPR
ncbi:PadR family transcriptional regulator [Nocardioides perillae]|uniref:DNA-binding PadR family transcriptional regulator n=1 Tax=Nocardioides perillae TaxID=1119534 RepID=A0A7Y9RPB1_9ACTN|nr:PadR family transcriptional regulator [Nocardioides perillae]NYG54067.1 DNA-binding PadR family transcriptional regulator [Nocardioides perillae]